ncbi:MAG: hypothetical protein AB8G22_12365 [Saprospiraceae bacterium]
MMTSAEQIVNNALSGIAFYYRDTNLSEHEIQQYRVSRVFQHPESLLLSDQFGGLTTNTRYVIASAHAKDSEKNKFWIEKEAYFKVLDIMVVNQRTQILLLHLPVAAVEIFTTEQIPFEDKLLETSRQIFIEHTYQPVAALQTEEWLAQTAAPIGMNAKGELHYNYEPQKPEQSTKKKVNQYKKGANPKEKTTKSFWQRLFG